MHKKPHHTYTTRTSDTNKANFLTVSLSKTSTLHTRYHVPALEKTESL